MVSEVFDCSLPHWEGGTWFICEALYQIKRGGGGAVQVPQDPGHVVFKML